MTLKSKHILIVDDDDDTNFLTRLKFEDADSACSLTFRTDASKALDYLTTGPDPFPDLILLDVNMPGLKGWDFLDSCIKEGLLKSKNTCVVMLSTSIYPEDKLRAKTYPDVIGYLEKPLNLESLRGLLETQH
ncbi:MAG: response regulator [Bacteroidota bacterium]